MNKRLLLLPILFFLLLLIPQVSKKLSHTEQPVSQSIRLFIYKKNNYASAAYDHTIASVRLRVCKIRNGKSIPVYDKTLSTMQLNQFPDAHNALNSKLIVPNILNSKEKLLVYYDVTYDTRGSQLTITNYQYTSATGKNEVTINI